MDKADMLERKLLGEEGLIYWSGNSEEGILGDHHQRIKGLEKIVQWFTGTKLFFLAFGFFVTTLGGILSIIWFLTHWGQGMAK